MKSRSALAGVTAAIVLALGGCATVPGPNAPTVMALPGTHTPPDQFRLDDDACRQVAVASLGYTTPTQAADSVAVANAAAGSLFGAATGAAIGSWSAQAGPGAAIGAGVGLLLGALAAQPAAAATGYNAQRAYDSAYLQCMYARGNKVPAGAVNRGPPVYSYPPSFRPAPPPG